MLGFSRQLDDLLKFAVPTLEGSLNPKFITVDKRLNRQLIKQADGIVFFKITKMGLGVAGSVGFGFVIGKCKDGSWSAPAAATVASLSVGWQYGYTKTYYIGLLTSESINQFRFKSHFYFGSEIGFAIGSYGRSLEGSFTMNGINKGHVSNSKSYGLWSGFALAGKMIKSHGVENRRFYQNEEILVADILDGKVARPENRNYQRIVSILKKLENIEVFENTPEVLQHRIDLALKNTNENITMIEQNITSILKRKSTRKSIKNESSAVNQMYVKEEGVNQNSAELKVEKEEEKEKNIVSLTLPTPIETEPVVAKEKIEIVASPVIAELEETAQKI